MGFIVPSIRHADTVHCRFSVVDPCDPMNDVRVFLVLITPFVKLLIRVSVALASAFHFYDGAAEIQVHLALFTDDFRVDFGLQIKTD